MSPAEFVPPEFVVPRRLEAGPFVLEPLGPEHNDEDYAAWSTSREHIHATAGWETSSWPREMTAEENRRDLERHAGDFERREGFTYTVLDREAGGVVGCVYIYPSKDGTHDAVVLSWVTQRAAALDADLWRAVTDWLEKSWPFEGVDYAPRA